MQRTDELILVANKSEDLIPLTMSDEDIYQAAMEEWLGVLVRLWQAVGKNVDAERLQIYQRELGDVPLGLLEKAVKRLIREWHYANVPNVNEIWKAVCKELDCRPDDVLDAIENWKNRSWERCFVRFDGVTQ